MLDAPAVYRRIYLPGANIETLASRHQQRLQAIGLNHVRLLKMDEMLGLANEGKRRIAEFHIRRNVWVPRPEVHTVNAVF